MHTILIKILLLLLLVNANSCFAEEKTQDFLQKDRDMVVWFFQKPVSPIMHEIISVHNIIFTIMMIVFVLVCILLLYIIFRFSEKRNPVPATFTHNTALEIAWTVLPLFLILIMAIPNIRALHHEEKPQEIDMTIKVVGHQWYWTYEYPESNIKFDSYMKKDDELTGDDKRLLSVDNPIVVPKGKSVKVIIAADDVIHSWAVPAFGVKKDAVPGRLNETWFRADEEGIYHGQCSELCGLLHGFMPIEVRVVSEDDYAKWIVEAKKKFSI